MHFVVGWHAEIERSFRRPHVMVKDIECKLTSNKLRNRYQIQMDKPVKPPKDEKSAFGFNKIEINRSSNILKIILQERHEALLRFLFLQIVSPLLQDVQYFSDSVIKLIQKIFIFHFVNFFTSKTAIFGSLKASWR